MMALHLRNPTGLLLKLYPSPHCLGAVGGGEDLVGVTWGGVSAHQTWDSTTVRSHLHPQYQKIPPCADLYPILFFTLPFFPISELFFCYPSTFPSPPKQPAPISFFSMGPSFVSPSPKFDGFCYYCLGNLSFIGDSRCGYLEMGGFVGTHPSRCFSRSLGCAGACQGGTVQAWERAAAKSAFFPSPRRCGVEGKNPPCDVAMPLEAGDRREHRGLEVSPCSPPIPDSTAAPVGCPSRRGPLRGTSLCLAGLGGRRH